MKLFAMNVFLIETCFFSDFASHAKLNRQLRQTGILHRCVDFVCKRKESRNPKRNAYTAKKESEVIR